ncbi:FliC/FljB family flagellin [Bordetella genomosp. 12]|uniref:Flagellin n=1 Tax=Bordetella genomosp. 12 TaxID=463035 RepID=A0A261VMX3_9BORD|nr:FliC/FljB family flagellin [Bordetella genomosp. 12]OZI75207.1 hypothetical protein CAL22_09340 [Bordetella genomosp. 12]
MAAVINTNYLSLVATNNLNKSQSALGTAIERLSSGLRINSAKDDAAGQAIANRFTANVEGLTQAARNANDGISVAQTTEGALNEINNNLQRIRQLTVQATTGTNSDSDLKSIQDEIGQRLEEIDRVSGQTQFNGVKVLAADKKMSIQVGSNDGETIDIDLEEITSSTLGLGNFNVDGKSTANKAAAETDLISRGTKIGTTDGVTQYSVATANTKATLSDVYGKLGTGSTAIVGGTTYTYNATSGSFTYGKTVGDDDDLATALTPTSGSQKATVTIGGSSQDVLISSDGSIKAADDGAALYLDGTGNLTKTRADSADPLATATNLAESLYSGGNGGGTVKFENGATYTAAGDSSDATAAGLNYSKADMTAALAASGGDVVISGTTYAIGTGSSPTVKNGTDVYIDPADGSLTITPETTKDYYVQTNGSVTTAQGTAVYLDDSTGSLTTEATHTGTATANPLDTLDKALSKVDSLRSKLGAIQNRFESTITNLNNTVNNLSAARSRIEDADYATEVSNMTKAQILQQAGTSVLAQANQVPQTVLSLLR